jgi:signal transduction histidine kinase
MDEATSDAVLGYAEKSVETLKDSDYVVKKARVISHEIRNQLSICDLYSEIIKKHSQAGNTEGVLNAINAINKALKMANNSLLALKTNDSTELKKVSLKETISNAVELAGVYLTDREIKLQVENYTDAEILADADKLVAVIINLVKNAVEAFPIEEMVSDDVRDGKYIKIKTEKDENSIQILISNNAPGITEPERIFYEGFTTKTTGSGLGLWICKKSIEEQMGELELSRSTEDYTEFTIRLGGE